MNPVVFCRALVMVGVGMATTAMAETNSSVDHVRFFSIPPVRLRTVDTERPAPGTGLQPGETGLHSRPLEPGSADVKVQPSHALTSVVQNDDPDFRLPYGGHYDFDLIRPARVSADPVTRVLNSVFRPEEFRVGRTMVSCSIVTAIKRKNPLCLLNPLVLSVSW